MLLRKHDIAMVVADTAGKWPQIEDVTSDFVYVRLARSRGALRQRLYGLPRRGNGSGRCGPGRVENLRKLSDSLRWNIGQKRDVCLLRQRRQGTRALRRDFVGAQTPAEVTGMMPEGIQEMWILLLPAFPSAFSSGGLHMIFRDRAALLSATGALVHRGPCAALRFVFETPRFSYPFSMCSA
jgi:hypothetical protein